MAPAGLRRLFAPGARARLAAGSLVVGVATASPAADSSCTGRYVVTRATGALVHGPGDAVVLDPTTAVLLPFSNYRARCAKHCGRNRVLCCRRSSTRISKMSSTISPRGRLGYCWTISSAVENDEEAVAVLFDLRTLMSPERVFDGEVAEAERSLRAIEERLVRLVEPEPAELLGVPARLLRTTTHVPCGLQQLPA